MSELLTRPPERKEMSPQETLAEAWVEAARSEYNHRKQSVEHQNATYEDYDDEYTIPRKSSHVAKSVLRHVVPPEDVGADVWAAEIGGDDDEASYGVMSSRDLELHIKHVNKLGRMGSQLRGTAADLVEGKWRPVGDLDISLVTGFAHLENVRQEALVNQQPDPLASQMALMEAFGII